jgi:hypothetical protein
MTGSAAYRGVGHREKNSEIAEKSGFRALKAVA